MKGSVLHIISGETLSPVIESQVLRPASRLCDRYSIKILSSTPIGQLVRPELRKRVRDVQRESFNTYGIPFHTVPSLPSRIEKPQFMHYIGKQAIQKQLKLGAPAILHARGPIAAQTAIMARAGRKDISVIFDCRGDAPSEDVGRIGEDPGDPESWSPNTKSRFELAVQAEKQICREADAIICVSEKMVELLRRRHHLEAEKFEVVPCCVDIERFSQFSPKSAKSKLGIADRTVISYLGSVEWYQMPEESIRLYKEIKKLDDSAFFLAITPHHDRMLRHLRDARVKDSDFMVTSVSPSEVPGLLPAADYGLLLRRLNPVNRVASPIKFAEYLASGVPLLTTSGVGDYSSAVTKQKIGNVIQLDTDWKTEPDNDTIRFVCEANHDQSVRDRCQSYARANLSLEIAEKRIDHLYGGLLSRPSGNCTPRSEHLCAK